MHSTVRSDCSTRMCADRKNRSSVTLYFAIFDTCIRGLDIANSQVSCFINSRKVWDYNNTKVRPKLRLKSYIACKLPPVHLACI
jgi:hypothetical protein